MPKTQSKQISEKVLFLIAAVVVAVPIVGYRIYSTVTTSPTDSTQPTQVPPNRDSRPQIPFQRKEIRSQTTQTGNTTETVKYETYGVVLTPEEEQKYYGDNPEYGGWEVAYASEILHRYPPGWGYFGFTSMLTSDNSGGNSGDTVSMNFARVRQLENWNYEEWLHSEIGDVVSYNTKSQFTKTDEFKTITGMKVSKFEDDNGRQVRLVYIGEQPDDRYINVIVNGMYHDVYEKHKDTIDQIIKSSTFVPYVYD